MNYLIDDANLQHIEEVFTMGIQGITANPSMYVKNNTKLQPFLKYCVNMKPAFLSAEVMGETFEEMMIEVEEILTISKDIIIKLCFSKVSLQVCRKLHERGIKTAMTLVFSCTQCAAAIHVGADYIFFFIGRNEEQGASGLELIKQAKQMCEGTSSHIIAASIKHQFHLQELCKMNIEYAAIPYTLYMQSLEHPLTSSGYAQFQKDWQNSNI